MVVSVLQLHRECGGRKWMGLLFTVDYGESNGCDSIRTWWNMKVVGLLEFQRDYGGTTWLGVH